MALAPSLALFGVPSSSISIAVDRGLVGGVDADDLLGDHVVDVLDGLEHALAAVALPPVAQLDRLVLAGGRARGHGGAADRAATRARPRPRPWGCRGSRGSACAETSMMVVMRRSLLRLLVERRYHTPAPATRRRHDPSGAAARGRLAAPRRRRLVRRLRRRGRLGALVVRLLLGQVLAPPSRGPRRPRVEAAPRDPPLEAPAGVAQARAPGRREQPGDVDDAKSRSPTSCATRGSARCGSLAVTRGRRRRGRYGGLGEELGQLGVLLGDLGEGLGAELQSKPTRAARCCSFLRRAARGSPSGTSWKMPSRPSCSRLMRSQRSLTSAPVFATASAKMCGWRRMSLTSMSWATLARSPAPALAQHEREQHDLQQQVAELAVLRRQVAGGDRVGQLVDLLHRVPDDVLRRLLAVPGALHAQHVDDALERDELLAEQGVVEGGAVGDGDGARGGAGGTEPARRRRRPGRRSSRASCGPPAPASATITSPAGRAATRSSRPSPSAGSISSSRPSPGSAASPTSSRSSPAEVGRNEDGAAAGQRPQRGCGRQCGGGADVHEREAHLAGPRALRRTAALSSAGRRPTARRPGRRKRRGSPTPSAASGLKPAAYTMPASFWAFFSQSCQAVACFWY